MPGPSDTGSEKAAERKVKFDPPTLTEQESLTDVTLFTGVGNVP